MKKPILLLFLLQFTIQLHSQVFNIDEIEKPPMMESCKEDASLDCFKSSLNVYLNQNIDVMKLIKDGKATAYAQFIVDTHGKTGSVQVRSTNQHMQEDVKRLIEKLKFLSPAMKNNEPVALKYVLPVKFKTREYASYNQFFQASIKTKVIPAKEAAILPTIKNCNERPCLDRMFKDRIIRDIAEKELFNTETNLKVKYTFMINEEGKITNIFVIHPSEEIQNLFKKHLKALEISEPARDKNGSPLAVIFTYNLN